ncbi:MAG TPA: hypothetical protein VFZ34_00260 [Blastocatellia bacterium]|nr:hypothetical protein [Blastocatellia bacterium]
MKTSRLIKAQNQKPTVPQAVGTRQPPQLAARESVLEWIREYQVSQPVNPRAQFAGLFKPIV